MLAIVGACYIATKKMTDIHCPIFRFKLAESVTVELKEFAQQYTTTRCPVELRAIWQTWLVDHSALVAKETERLRSCGYEGDVAKKLYTSVRYYRQLRVGGEDGGSTSRTYLPISSALREAMRTHVVDVGLRQALKPQHALRHFLVQPPYADLVAKDIAALLAVGLTQPLADLKLKKAYKNQYFRVRSSHINGIRADC